MMKKIRSLLLLLSLCAVLALTGLAAKNAPAYDVLAPKTSGETVTIAAAQAPKTFTLPGRLVLDFEGGGFKDSSYGVLKVNGGVVKAVRYNQFDDGTPGPSIARVVLDLVDGHKDTEISVRFENGVVTASPTAPAAPAPAAPAAPAETAPAETAPAETEAPEAPAETPSEPPEVQEPEAPEAGKPVPISEPSEPAAKEASLVVLDAGHGGDDTGAIAFNSNEKDVVLPIALRAGALLEDAGIRVAYTRVNDEAVSLADRVLLAENQKADLFVAVHANAYDTKPELNGVETYCFERGGESEVLAKELHAAVLEATGANDNLQRTADYYVLRNTTMPAVLLETGYMTNEAECAKLASSDYQEKIARAIANTVLVHLGMQPLANS